MNLTLVPFGYKISQNQLVDVQQVPSGKRCGCICPSCKAPLVARKGNKKRWHFAHDSKGELKNKLEKCNFSFYVSARMMARQLIGNSLSIYLPKLTVALSAKIPIFNENINIAATVTAARNIILQDVAMDTSIAECRVDLCGVIDGYNLGIIFTHPGRDEISNLADFTEQKVGIVAISLTGLKERFYGQKEPDRSYSDILTDFITNDILSKKWLYHPRLQETEQQVQKEIDDRLDKAQALFNQTKKPATSMQFDCRICKSSWIGKSTSNTNCKSCGALPILVGRTEIP